LITSVSNPKVKLLRSLRERKHRREHSLCLVEGIRLLEEALASGLKVHPILYSPERLSASAAGRALRPRLERMTGPEQVDDRVLADLTETVASQGIVAAVEIPVPSPLPATGHVLVLDGIADPGNAGTMLRTARAAGAVGIVATSTTADLWAPKVVRAGMGAHFYLGIHQALSWPDVANLLGKRQLLLATAHHGTPHWLVDWEQPSAIVIGSEAHGLSASTATVAARMVTIPMEEGAESLNAAAAAAILLFAARAATISARPKDVGGGPG
jgi:RNA methyltransferase, TrmH family